ncbi:MAG: AmmeMemoRadiSam system radical SAM enzyme [DPANN group archaeon]|nr:AmmeMemoRadiSam system radical SAM enzyme [DPANN group archaeon]
MAIPRPIADKERSAGKSLQKARYWRPFKSMVQCELCPKRCVIAEGKAGFCSIRKNIKGTLYTLGYGNPVGFAIDPIEKKPFYHFLPGSSSLSFGTVGCNLGCLFCQNWQTTKSDLTKDVRVSPEEVVDLALAQGVPSISYTYNEPTIFFEYVVDIARLAHRKGIRNVLVSNGFISDEPRKEWSRWIDAVNVDLKAFTEEFYRRQAYAMLQPVLDTIRYYHGQKHIWMELTNLKIPTLNDSPAETRKMSRWIVDTIGPDHPLHLTAFHPAFRLEHLPPTPAKTLTDARDIALEEGLHHVYCGNIMPGKYGNTYCSACGSLLIRRGYMSVEENHLLEGGMCPVCRTKLPGVF